MNYTFTKDAQEAYEIAKKIRSEEKVIGHDCETTGLDPHTDKVILTSISTRNHTYLIDNRDPRTLEAQRELLEDEKIGKLGFNHLFDYVMNKGTCGIEIENSWDLFLGEIALTNGIQYDGRNLAAVTKKYLGKERDKSLQKSFINFKGEFTPAQLQYAAEDTDDLFGIFDVMRPKIVSEGLLPTWRIENEVIPCFGDIQFYGQKISVPAWLEIMAQNKIDLKKAMGELDNFYGQVYPENTQAMFDFMPATEEIISRLDVNYASPAQILWGLQMLGVTVDGETIRDTSKDTQKKIQHLPVIIALGGYRRAKRAIDAYGQNFLDAIHPKTNRIHPMMWQWGTDSGRPSGRGGINVLNLPRDKRYRHAFCTDDDRMISTVDFSGAELRIMADQSGDQFMVDGFNSGVDFHCFVVGLLFNKKNVDKKDPLRQPVKTLNFGIAYGMGPGKLCAQLNGEGHKITIEESKDLFDKYKQTFKGAIRWLDEQKQIARSTLEMVNVNGRKRRWIAPNVTGIKEKVTEDFMKKLKGKTPSSEQEYFLKEAIRDAVNSRWAGIEREGANNQVQSVNVEWTKTSMTEIRRECKKRNYDAKFYNSVYDETVLDVAKKDSEAVHELQKKIMIECGTRFTKKVPVEVEGHLKPHWTK